MCFFGVDRIEKPKKSIELNKPQKKVFNDFDNLLCIKRANRNLRLIDTIWGEMNSRKNVGPPISGHAIRTTLYVY